MHGPESLVVNSSPLLTSWGTWGKLHKPLGLSFSSVKWNNNICIIELL